jgi:hypothetical protein
MNHKYEMKKQQEKNKRRESKVRGNESQIESEQNVRKKQY